ncbi:tRNA 4-thiouridine(8) synthase ThiI [Christensenellaceae bacterium NSJ-44]|uniref:Probable tRNA sulfurtransferase n=1 Tax=Luoshenia tenuis TaxID=2763654 RepID=A0A926HMT4_9FIRM|nr:tRNA uracil 4-sulfurtransferase ThiI [Luoshenia tenuis]MBC8528441.1 tRNA 4-thiouridine(8) synthase ThiI [Luoshenia tenuis]
MEQLILVRFGEIHLKGLNRPYFEHRLVREMKRRLYDEPQAAVEKGDGRYYIRGVQNLDAVMERIRKVFGVHSLSPAIAVEKDISAIRDQAVEMMRDKRPTTFKVKARRADKRFPMTSPEICEEVGGYILENLPGWKVDVHHPEVTLEVEVREQAFLHCETLPAAGGMPVGTNGRAFLLLSGGIDSPVAGYMVAKRGVAIEAVHFFSYPYTGEPAKEKVLTLAKLLSEYAGPVRVHVVPFTKIQQEIYQKCPEGELTVIMRRFMMRIAQGLAQRGKGGALVTGESIGQVASQTMEALAATDAVVDMPVFRPVIGMDKQEIMEIAMKIGTYETSILPYEDCCTVFTPRHPVTRPKLERIEASEKVLDIGALVQEAIDGTEEVTFNAAGRGLDE